MTQPKNTTGEHIDVTIENIEDVAASMAAIDQANEIVPGCQTWPIIYQPGNQRGQGTWWPGNRVAICLGADSIWGDAVDDETMMADDDGHLYDLAGNPVSEMAQERAIEEWKRDHRDS